MRLIDADKLRKDILDMPNCYNGFSDTYDKAMIMDMIDEQSSVDAVPVIYCKDCGHYNAGFECLIEGYGIDRDPTYFCGDAIPKIERKEE